MIKPNIVLTEGSDETNLWIRVYAARCQPNNREAIVLADSAVLELRKRLKPCGAPVLKDDDQ